MSDTVMHYDWAKPSAMAIPKEGFLKLEQGDNERAPATSLVMRRPVRGFRMSF